MADRGSVSAAAQGSETQVAAPRRRRALVLAVLGGLSATPPLATDLYLPALPQVADDLAASPPQVQLTLTTFILGLAFGQLCVGPLSDAVGRRRPLIAGLIAFTVASLLCAAAPSAGVLIALRLVQGLSGSAGVVIARAMVSDLYEGSAAARAYSRLLLVTGLAPVLAPLAGGQILRFTSWRGLYVILGVIGALLLLAVVLVLRESVADRHRAAAGPRPAARSFARLLGDRHFVGYALVQAMTFGALFAYISGSPFLIQAVHGASPQLFSVLFGANALGMVVASQVGGAVVGRIAPRRLLVTGLSASLCGASGLLVASLAGGLGLIPTSVLLFLVVASVGLILPNSMALAIGRHSRTAGGAAALLGSMQFFAGGLAAPLSGLAGDHAIGMAVVIVAALVLAATALTALARESRA